MANDSLIPSFEEITGPKARQQETQQPRNGNDKPKRPPAQFWVNVGKEKNGKLLTLPMGIPLDGLTAKPIKGKPDSEFAKMRAAEADMWEQFWAFCKTLKPGEAKRLNFVVEVRRVSEQEAVEEETNEFALGKLDFT